MFEKIIRSTILATWALPGLIPLSYADITLPAKTIEQRLRELEQEIQLLKRTQEVNKEIQYKKDTETPLVVSSKEGFALKSPDSDFQLKFRGQAQADGRYFINNDTPSGSNAYLIRRLRPTLEGTVFKYFDFRLMPDFGNGATVLQDAWIDFKYWKQASLRAGKFKSPLSLERLQPDAWGLFIEGSLSSNLAPNRDIGLDLHGDFFNGALSYDAGIFNGVQDGSSLDTDIHDDKEFVGRIFAQPFRNTSKDLLNGLGLGLGGSFGTAHSNINSNNLPAFRSAGQQTIFSYTPTSGTVIADGNRFRLAPQAYYYLGPIGILGEYIFSNQDISKGTSTADITNTGWNISGSYVLTGEDATYDKGVMPRYDFDPSKGKWGAFEVVSRFSWLDIDDDVFPVYANPLTSVTGAKSWTIGLNWYLNRSIKVLADFDETFYNGGRADGGDRQNEHALFTRLQLYI